MAENAARGRATRTANMAMRRDRILDTARDIIAESGFEALGIRELARRAGVTVPTIYNLIGNKSALVAQLFNDTISPFEDLQFIGEDDDPVGAPERFFENLIAWMRGRENYHRAEFLAREHLRKAGDAVAVEMHERVIGIAIEACEQLRNAGVLLGAVGTRQLGELVEHQVRLAFHDWAHGAVNLEQFRRRLIVGTYLCLAADASSEYHPRFIEKLRSCDSDDHVVRLGDR